MSNINLLMYDPMQLCTQADLASLKCQGIHVHPILQENQNSPKSRPHLDDKAAEALANHFEQKLGKIQGLISLSGSLGMLMPLWQTPPTRMHEIFMDNLFINYLLIKTFHHLFEDKLAKIFLAEYTMDKSSLAYWGAFEMSQQSLITMQKILKEEHEHRGIDVHLLHIGAYDSPIYRQAYPAKAPNSIPIGQVISKYLIKAFCPKNANID